MFKILPSCECTCDVRECQGFSPELLIVAGRLPLMDAGSEPAFEVMPCPSRAQSTLERIGAVGFPQKAVSSHVVCSHSPLLSLPFS